MTKTNSRESLAVEVNPKPANGRKSEPIHIKEILPGVMRNIRNRMKNRGQK